MKGLQRILALAPGYKDAEELLCQAQEQLDREARLYRLYADGVAASVQEDWQTAVCRFEEILALQAGYRDVEHRLGDAQRAMAAAPTPVAASQSRWRIPIWALGVAGVLCLALAALSVALVAGPGKNTPTPTVMAAPPDRYRYRDGDRHCYRDGDRHRDADCCRYRDGHPPACDARADENVRTAADTAATDAATAGNQHAAAVG